MRPKPSATRGRLVDYVEVQHALAATVYENCRLRKSEEHFWQVSLSPINLWVLCIVSIDKPEVFILWQNLSRYLAAQQWEEASHLMGHIFKLMRWILGPYVIMSCLCYYSRRASLGHQIYQYYECHYAGICWSLLKPKSNWRPTKLDMGPPKTNRLLWNFSSYNI